MKTRTLSWLLIALFATPALAIDDAHKAKAQAAIDKGLNYLRSTQAADGSWTAQPGPAITAMVATAMLRNGATADDPHVAKAFAFVKTKRKPDGGFYDSFLLNYNTALTLVMLSEMGDSDEIKSMIAGAQKCLTDNQYRRQVDPHGDQIGKEHAYYGGAGYGKHGRPDMSNTAIMLTALHDSGLKKTDPAYKAAMTFLQRCQGAEENKMLGGKIVQDGGFIYATSINKDHIGTPQSMASPEEKERALAGNPMKSRLRTYGSMTYAGFMGYLYGNLPKHDPRVLAARHWIGKNYTLDENPGVGMQGYYYYLHLFSRALHANGEAQLKLADGSKRDWANDLVDKLCALQKPDGSWVNQADRWMEGDPNLVTAYALLALQYATK